MAVVRAFESCFGLIPLPDATPEWLEIDDDADDDGDAAAPADEDLRDDVEEYLLTREAEGMEIYVSGMQLEATLRKSGGGGNYNSSQATKVRRLSNDSPAGRSPRSSPEKLSSPPHSGGSQSHRGILSSPRSPKRHTTATALSPTKPRVGSSSVSSRSSPSDNRKRPVFRNSDVGRTLTIIRDLIEVDGRPRVAQWGNARRQEIPAPGLVITDVHERLKGLVTLQGGEAIQNPMPGAQQDQPGGEGLRSKIMTRGF